uniref:Chitin-binding type-2 domain-containing protein n=1 Tax=Anopheles culicifacies TaxID=139723 RepID=A0A182MPA4_9DIPT
MTTPGLFQCTAEGRYPDPSRPNCESYVLCVKNSIGTLTPIQFFCPPTTIFSATAGLCVSVLTYSCEYETTSNEPPTSVAPTTSTTFIPTPTPFVCTKAGKYPNPHSIYCKSYYYCLYDSNMNLIGVELTCPGSSIFATDELRCVPAEKYQCERGIATTAATISSSASTTATATITTTTTSATSTIGMGGGCKTAGKFPTDTPNDCSSYQFCVMLASGELVELILTCPGNTLFDEVKKVCSDKFVCSRGP